MSDRVTTNYKKGGYAESDDVVLSTAPTTRVIFRGGLHPGGVRGKIIRQKIGADKTWGDVNEVNFSSMPPDSGVKIDLDTEAVSKLRNHLDQLDAVQSEGVRTGRQELVVAPEDQVIRVTENNRREVLRQLAQSGHTNEVLSWLVEHAPNEVESFFDRSVRTSRQAVIKKFEGALEESHDEDFWQKFFEDEPWILQAVFSAPVFLIQGETYVGGKISRGRNGAGGVATDFLFGDESTKSFAVVEIKTPDTKLVGKKYRGERDTDLANETYCMHSDLSGGVVQTRNQIATAIQDFQSVIGREHRELNGVHPRGVLLIGTLADLEERERVSFNHFRHGLYSLSILTYDELLNRLKTLFSDST